MLSNPPTTNANLHLRQRQRQHRRLNSTPSAFEAVKIAPLPNFQQQRSPQQRQQQQQRARIAHRRGLSLDTNRQRLSPCPPTTTVRQDYTTVSTSTTNNSTSTGLATTPQHVLRESQQQRAAGPGSGQPNTTTTTTTTTTSNFANEDDSENFLLSPYPTPHRQRFVDAFSMPAAMQDMGFDFDAYAGPGPAMLKRSQTTTNLDGSAENRIHSKMGSGPAPQSRDGGQFGTESSPLSTASFANFPDSSPTGSQQGWVSEGEATTTHQTRRTSRRISNGIMDRVSKFESLGAGADSAPTQRPITPPPQNANNYLPPTPMQTPHDRMTKQEAPRLNRFSEDYDESMEETIKPVRNNTRPSNRNSGIFQDLRQQVEGATTMAAAVQTPERSSAASAIHYANLGLATPEFMNMANFNAEFVKMEQSFDADRRNSLSTACQDLFDQMGSAPPSAHTATLRGLNVYDHRPDLAPPGFAASQTGATLLHSELSSRNSSPSRRGSPHRRTESLASIASAASIASINIEETKTETGVTLEDIAAYIDGPDPADGKWVCRYEGCGKKFGRKENIKSHVQTHLNDRQYRCPTCRKCFVRQHDLKRHAKIHTGIKPYPCECGNSFARHDALTRHRQRGMCIGAFDGVVRRVVKRGRPRKNRPDLDERRDKRERTRRKNRASTAAAAASESTSPSSSSSGHSGYEDSSAGNSPATAHELDGLLDDDDDQQFCDMMDVGGMDMPPATTVTMNPTDLSVSCAPMPTLEGGAAMSPAEVLTVISPEQIHSPGALSHYSHVSHASIGGPPPAEGDLRGGDLHDQPTLPGSPAKSVASHYTHQPGTPPELSASSSPPPTGTTSRFFDADPHSSGLSGSSLALGSVGASCGGGSMGSGAGGGGGGEGGGGGMGGMTLEEEMLLFANEGGLVQLDRDLMLGSKFDDEYDPVTMFTNSDDVFFGSA